MNISADLPGDVEAAINAAKDGLSQAELLGNCPYNARRLADELRDRGYEANIVRGACVNSGESPETIREAEERGIVHWWVRVEVDGVRVVADLATEIDDAKGETIIRTESPTEYVAFETNPPGSTMFKSR